MSPRTRRRIILRTVTSRTHRTRHEKINQTGAQKLKKSLVCLTEPNKNLTNEKWSKKQTHRSSRSTFNELTLQYYYYRHFKQLEGARKSAYLRQVSF